MWVCVESGWCPVIVSRVHSGGNSYVSFASSSQNVVMFLCTVLYHGIQSVEVAKDVVFPSRTLKRQLQDAEERLKQMEDELRTMKENERARKRQKTEVFVVVGRKKFITLFFLRILLTILLWHCHH